MVTILTRARLQKHSNHVENSIIVILNCLQNLSLGAESCNANKVPSDIILTMRMCILLMAQYLVELGSPNIAIT